MSLDDKLREIVDFEGETEEYANETIAQIKQAFADEGWIHSPLVDYQFKRIKSGELMTGQEFFDRFEPLLEDIDLNSKTRYRELKEAAKKASGIIES